MAKEKNIGEEIISKLKEMKKKSIRGDEDG
jgi:hypothetical protein